MPELPEVETIRRGLATRILDVPITRVEVRLPKITSGSAEPLETFLTGNRIMHLDRQGKLLIARHNHTDAFVTLIHLKMTGQLIYRNQVATEQDQVAGGHPWPAYNDRLPNAYTHVILEFANGGVLFFNDLRQFGYIRVATTSKLHTIQSKYGIEPLRDEFTWEAFHQRLSGRRGNIKALLLNQSIISGIGNIYADEILFDAAVAPSRMADTLTEHELRSLYDSTQKIIALAIEHRGTTIHDYADADGKRGNFADLLQVYAQEGKTCKRCGLATITKAKVAGRGTHWCPNCQK